MSLLDIFDGSKQFSEIAVPLSSARVCKPTDMTALDEYLNVSMSSHVTGGTAYAQEYIKEEEEKMLAVNSFRLSLDPFFSTFEIFFKHE